MINLLVGIADKDIVLARLDPNTRYDFLDGQTPGQAMQQLQDQKTVYRNLARYFETACPQLTEEEMGGYLERTKIYGEAEAMRRVIQQHPPGNP